MAKSALTLEIENQALKQFSKMGVFMCPECSFERAWIKEMPANVSLKEFHTNPKYMQVEGKHIRTEIVDILELNSQKGWVCYEIKISKSDFHSKAIKSFVGDYNYYLMPDELYEQIKDEIPKEIGVYSYNGKNLYLKKKARRKKLIDGIDGQLYYGMVRSLSRERDKLVRNRINPISLQINQTYEKFKKIKEEKRDKLWELRDKLPYPQEQINELEIELDILDDIHRELSSIKYNILRL